MASATPHFLLGVIGERSANIVGTNCRNLRVSLGLCGLRLLVQNAGMALAVRHLFFSVKNYLTTVFSRDRLCKIKRTMQTNSDPVYRTGFSDGFAAAARRELPGVLVVGGMTLQRLENGTLSLGDGVAFTSLNQVQFEAVLKKVLASRWNDLHKEINQTYESGK